MVGLVARLGPRAILEQLRSAGPQAVWMLIAYSIGTSIGALPWYLLLPRVERPALAGAIASRFAASGANAILPLLGFGGEPARLLWLAPHARAAGIAAIVFDRLLYAGASAVFLLAGALAVAQLAEFPRSYVIVGAIGALLLFVITGIAIWLVSRHRIAGRIHRVIRRMLRRVAPDASELGPRVDDAIEQIAAHRERMFVLLFVHVIGRLVLASEIYVGFLILGVPLGWDQALVFATVPILLAFVGAVVPSQIGIQESTQALVATALGLSPVTAVTVVLLQRIRQLVTGALAWFIIMLARGDRAD
jgi:hypothetical protein